MYVEKYYLVIIIIIRYKLLKILNENSVVEQSNLDFISLKINDLFPINLFYIHLLGLINYLTEISGSIVSNFGTKHYHLMLELYEHFV